MADEKPNFIMIPDGEPEPEYPPRKGVALFERMRTLVPALEALVPHAAPRAMLPEPALPDRGASAPGRARLVFGFDATASREPAWAIARNVTDALVRALPGELDVALAVHGGSRLHTFTEFTADANTLRDRAAGVTCQAGRTQLLPILSGSPVLFDSKTQSPLLGPDKKPLRGLQRPLQLAEAGVAFSQRLQARVLH